MKMSTMDAVILTHADKKREKYSFFLPEQRIRSLELNTPDSLPKSLENIIGFSGYSISYRRSNPGFLFLLAIISFSFTVYLEVVFTSHQFRQFYHDVTP